MGMGFESAAAWVFEKSKSSWPTRLSLDFKRSVYALVRRFPSAARDLRYRDQLFGAAAAAPANIAEGSWRRTAREFRQYLSNARGSLTEGKMWIEDGVDRGYFPADEIQEPLILCRRAGQMIARLQRSLIPFIDHR